MAQDVAPLALQVWRHPRPRGVEGRCIGRTDVPVDARKAKRLAHRIRRQARRQGWERVVVTSPLRRCFDVGAWLARWGWRHEVDARLCELDFGAWDGRPWTEIGAEEVAAWCASFADHAPGGGESLQSLFRRCHEFLDALRSPSPALAAPRGRCVVAHAGWMNALRFISDGKAAPRQARDWPAAPAYAAWLSFTVLPKSQ